MSQRMTLKQKGGASLVNWPTVGEERKAAWKEALDKTPFRDILEPKTEKKAEHLELWFRAMENQDELFDIAQQLMLKAAKLEDPTDAGLQQKIVDTDPAVLENRRTELVQFLADVESMVNFNKKAGKSNVTKLTQISRNKTEPLLTLFLFPKRLHNMFLESLASIFVTLKSDQRILSQMKNPTLTNVAAAQYRSYVLSNIMTHTGMIQRDGYYLDYPCTQTKNDFVANISDKFYTNLLVEINKNIDLPFEKLFTNEGECTHFIETWSWEVIAAHVFLAYKLDKLPQVLSVFNTECKTSKEKKDEYSDMTVRGVRFGNILSNMSYSKLEFILHLCQKITQATSSLQETEVKANLTA